MDQQGRMEKKNETLAIERYEKMFTLHVNKLYIEA